MPVITISPNPSHPGDDVTICVDPAPTGNDVAYIDVSLQDGEGQLTWGLGLRLTAATPCATFKLPAGYDQGFVTDVNGVMQAAILKID